MDRRRFMWFLLLAFLIVAMASNFLPVQIPDVKGQGTITETFYSQTYDGEVSLLASPTYADARNASAGVVYDTLETFQVGQWHDGGFDYKVMRSFVFFDTSSLYDDANITSAILSLYIKTNSTTVDFNVTVMDGSPIYPHTPLVAGDYYYNHYSGNGGSRNTSEIADLGYWNISLSTQGIGWINKGGVSKFCLRSSRDIDNIAPTTSAETIEIYAAEISPWSYVPTLFVTTEAYSYTFHGLFDESTGLLKGVSERAVDVTAYYLDESSTTFEVNGTYIYNTTLVPLYFHFDLGSKDREYWISQEEVNIDIYIFTQTLTTYNIYFLDLAGVLDDNPFVKAEHLINGSLVTVEQRKVDQENKLQFSMVQGSKYTIIIQDGTSYTFGDLLMTSTTTVQLTLKGIEFPKETLLTYKYVRIYGERHDWRDLPPAWTTPPTVHSKCGEETGHEANKSIDGDTGTYWTHTDISYHWIVFDFGVTETITKIRLYQDATTAWGQDIGLYVYVSDNASDFGSAVWEGVLNSSGWQDSGNFSKEGRYVKLESKSNNPGQRMYEFQAYYDEPGRSSISIIYEDSRGELADVTVDVCYKNFTSVGGIHPYTYTSSFNHTWASALSDTDYLVVVSIDHERYGLYGWRQYFPRRFSDPPWSLDFLGTLPFDTSIIIPTILLIFIPGCFSVLNSYVGAFMLVIMAMVFAYLGWIPISAAALVTAFALAVLMAIIYAKRKVQT